MNRLFSLAFVIPAVLFVASAAIAKQHQGTGYETATIVAVEPAAATSNYVGTTPTDAPLMPQTYNYDVRIRLNCNVYVGRYESATDYLPTAFAANHTVDVRLTKHVLYVSLPQQDREIKMSIIGRKQLKEQACPAAS